MRQPARRSQQRRAAAALRWPGRALAAVLLLTGADGRAAAQAPAAAPARGVAEVEAPATPPLNAVPPVGAIAEDPVAEAKREVYASCLHAEFPENFARWQDLNGDGEPDALFTYNVVCDGFRGALCDASGCPGVVFVSDGDGAYRKTDLPPDVTVREPYQGRPAVALTLSGTNCRAGVRLCRGVRVWDGTAFVPPDQLRVAAAPRREEEVGDAVLAARPATPEPTAAEIAVAAEDYDGTADLFDRLGPRPDPVVEARIDALAAAGALRAARGWRAFRPTSEWSYEPMGRGRARAWVRGEFGASDLQIACRAGEPTVAVAFFSREGVFGRAYRSGVAAPADVVISGQLRETVLLRYVRRRDVWVGRANPQGALLEWLRRGSAAFFLEPGAILDERRPAARFALRGSRRAIEAAFRACGLI